MTLDFRFIESFTTSNYYQEVINCRSSLLFNSHANLPYFYLDDLEDDLNSYHYGAFEKEALVAYVRISIKEESAKLSRIFVKEQYRGKGIGYKMISSLLEVCLEKSVNEVILFSRLDAVNFYKKLGFVNTSKFIISPTSGSKLEKMIFYINTLS